MSRSPQNARRSRWKLLRLLLLASLTAVTAPPLFLGARLMVGLVYGPCARNREVPADYGYKLEDIILPARSGGSFRGYFIAGSNGATVIIPPTGADSRNHQLHKAALLRQHGYNVFTFESRRCAGQGPLSLGYAEVNEVADALAYLQTRPDVDPDRIGIWGFSTAGATTVMAMARLPALRAGIAEGGYGNFLETALSPPHPGESGVTRFFLTLHHGSAMVTYRLVTGTDIRSLNPAGVIDQIAPRPILLIYGGNEVSLPGAYHQKKRAGENAELWVIPGAGHGNYWQIAGQAYEERAIQFFEETLKDENP